MVFAGLSLWIAVDSSLGLVNSPLPSCTDPALPCGVTVQLSREDVQTAAGLDLPINPVYFMLASSLTAKLSLVLIGLIIFLRRSDTWIGISVSAALMSVLVEGTQSIPPALEAVQTVLSAIGTVLFLPIPFIFPSGRFEPAWLRWPVVTLALFYGGLMFFSETPQFVGIQAILTLVWVLLAFFAMPYRYFRLSGLVERQQIKWVIVGFAVVFINGIFYTTGLSMFPISEPSEARILAMLVNVILYPISYGFFALSILLAILRYKLWDIDVLIRKTLLYSVLTGLLALVYFGSVVLLQAVLGPIAGSEDSTLVTVFSTLGIAALFHPLRQRVQAVIDRRLYRAKYSAEKALNEFAQAARSEVDVDRLNAALLSVVQATMQPERHSLWIALRRESTAIRSPDLTRKVRS